MVFNWIEQKQVKANIDGKTGSGKITIDVENVRTLIWRPKCAGWVPLIKWRSGERIRVVRKLEQGTRLNRISEDVYVESRRVLVLSVCVRRLVAPCGKEHQIVADRKNEAVAK